MEIWASDYGSETRPHSDTLASLGTSVSLGNSLSSGTLLGFDPLGARQCYIGEFGIKLGEIGGLTDDSEPIAAVGIQASATNSVLRCGVR